MPSVKINSMVKLQALCLLSNGPRHGYEIIKELEISMRRRISSSHVYPFLKDLEENNIISCEKVDKRDKKSYVLTKNGQEFVEIVFSKLGNVIESVIQRKLSTCNHCNCKVYETVHSEIINDDEYSFCCMHCAKAFKQSIILTH